MYKSDSRSRDSVLTPQGVADMETAQIWAEEESTFRITGGNCLHLCPSPPLTSSKGTDNAELIFFKKVALVN